MVDTSSISNFDVGEEIRLMFEPKGMRPATAATSRNAGQGPYKRLVLRGATVIDGTGAPPSGPVDIVVEGGRITELKVVGAPLKAINPANRPAQGDYEIDCHGKYVTPGLIDCHAHVGTPWHGMSGEVPTADYVYKLWLAHGVTTAREMGSMNGLGYMLEQREASANNQIAAPRLLLHAYFPAVNERIKTIYTPERASDKIIEIG